MAFDVINFYCTGMDPQLNFTAEVVATGPPGPQGDPASALVTSVNGKQGVVVLNKSDVGLANVDNTSDVNKPISTATQTALNAKEPSLPLGSPTQYFRGDKTLATLDKTSVGLSNVDNTSDINKPVSAAQQSALNAKESTANKNAANGYAGLDSSGKVAAAQLPAYVDDVQEFANLAAFPATGNSGFIYVADDTGKIYRWSGTQYIEISPSPGSTDAVPEGSTNLYFTNARASAAAPVQSVAGRTGAVTLTKSDVGLANVDNTSDANKPVSTAQATALSGKLHNLVPATTQTANFTVTINTKVQADTTTGNITATLPTTATLGDVIFVQKSDATTNVLTLSGAINSVTSSTLPLRTQLQAKLLQWDGTYWQVIAGDLSLPALDLRYTTTNNVIPYIIALG